MQYDIWKIIILLAVGAVTGFAFGYPLEATLFVAIGIIAWQIRRLQMIYSWVRNPSRHPLAESTGQLYLLHSELSRNARATKLRKKQLTKMFSQFRQAVSVLPDAIVLIDDQRRIRWANNNAEKLFGIRWPADVNVRFGNLIRDPRLDKLLLQPLSNESQTDNNDAPAGIEIKSRVNDEKVLNVKIIPYTKELSMVLARDVSRLVKVNQMHTDFVANVSHELKTPLTVLRGYLEIIQAQNGLDEKLVKPIEQMALQSERMQMIVQDLLFLSKLEEPNNRRKPELIDVTNLLNTIVEMIQPKVALKGHKINLDIDYGLKVYGNQSELHSAFSNLIVNAVNYTSKNGVIHIRWYQNEAGGPQFEVKDNGQGIPAQHIPRLTERFYRIDADRSRDGGGTGLGLAIVKHVLQRHEAKLEIDSSEGKGSRFACLFPPTRLVMQTQASQQSSTS